jgi:hypothetical protein
MLEIVDRCLQWLIDHQGNNWPLPVHPAMASPHPSPFADEEYESWLPIASTVTDQQLDELETAFGYLLPAEYRRFLQHKHFYELMIGGAEFFSHPIDQWQQILHSEVLTNWPPDYPHEGLIPFALWGGAGDVLCFAAISATQAGNYPVVLWNHENGSTDEFSTSFAELLVQLYAVHSFN